MAPYFAEIVAMVLFSFLGYGKSESSRRGYLLVIFSILTLVAGLRGIGVGSDTLQYSWSFDAIARSDTFLDAPNHTSLSAPVYVFINWIVSRFTSNYQVILFVNAAIVSVCISRMVAKTSSDYVISCLCFIGLAAYFQSMNGMREYVAVAISINAYLFFCESGYKSIKGWVLQALAVGIHATASIMILPTLCLFFIQSQKCFKSSIRKIAIGAIVAGLLSTQFIALFMQIFAYYQMYAGDARVSVYEASSGGRIILLYLFLALVVILPYLKLGKDEKWESQEPAALLFPLAIFTVVFGIAFARNFLMNRMVWYFMVSFVSFIPYSINKLSGGYRILGYMAVFLVLGIWCLMQLLENKSGVVPYVLGIA